jgi:hypothetical protein
MSHVDAFSRSLLEEAKRFLEKAESSVDDGRLAFLHASVMLAMSSLEAHVNGVASDFSERQELTVLERSVLSELDFRLENGEFKLTNSLKMYRLEDRIEFLFARFGTTPLDRNAGWHSKLHAASIHRNNLVHPKTVPETTVEIAREAITAVIDAIDALYLSVYKRRFPAKGKGLHSKLTF